MRPARRAFFKAGNRPFAKPNAFLLCDRRQDRQHSVFEDPATVQVLLGEAPVADANALTAAGVV
jgi:hypothetical protein